MTPTPTSHVLEVKGLKKHFPIIEQGILQRQIGAVKAVDDVSFSLTAGETLGLVGESGCGKTTIGRCLVRIYQPTAGEVLYQQPDGQVRDLAKLNRAQLKPVQRQVRMIFQDPFSSLNPRMTVLDIVGDPLRVHKVCRGQGVGRTRGRAAGAGGAARRVSAPLPARLLGRTAPTHRHCARPGPRPALIICDEAVSALDVSVRAQILNLLLDLRQEFDLTYIFISHDLSVVEYIADRVAVMYVGRLAEIASTRELYVRPLHPYTEALLSAVPNPDPDRRSQRIILEGEVADPARPPNGCYFHPRCRYAEARCKVETPALRVLPAGWGQRQVACHRAEALDLKGITR